MWGLLYIRSLANRPEGRQAGQQGWEGAQLKIRDERSKASVDGDEDSLRSERKGNHQPIPPDAGFKAALALVLYTEATWPLLQRQTGRTIQTPLASLPPPREGQPDEPVGRQPANVAAQLGSEAAGASEPSLESCSCHCGWSSAGFPLGLACPH